MAGRPMRRMRRNAEPQSWTSTWLVCRPGEPLDLSVNDRSGIGSVTMDISSFGISRGMFLVGLEKSTFVPPYDYDTIQGIRDPRNRENNAAHWRYLRDVRKRHEARLANLVGRTMNLDQFKFICTDMMQAMLICDKAAFDLNESVLAGEMKKNGGRRGR
jgi:hypothetical protein